MTIKTYFRNIGQITKKTFIEWNKKDPFRQSATVSYYAVFSMPALLVIIIACAGLAFGREAVEGQISRQIGSTIGYDTSKQIEEIIAKASETKSSIWATIISVVTLILGCTGVFGQLQISLNQIWGVKPSPKKKWLKSLKDRVFSFGIVITIAFLMLVSLLVSAFLNGFSDWIKAHLPDFMLFVFQGLNFLISFGIISTLFAVMFKVLPDVKVPWRSVWIGAFATTLLFLLGKFALGLYFGKANPGSTYGAAGSIILVMLWVSYSSMLVFLGAEFTKQYMVHHGEKIQPKKSAVLIGEVTKDNDMVAKPNLEKAAHT
ncbi:MAG TPA: YihY/virulence factor BrkB family protein [Bacteroidia bacterium]|jgi:membrane protein|nr:YihY/virulence factor BrkB family protein [Bacteroidia bacterium]